MDSFPLIDPIPLPAPVWLMKLLHIVTMSLHFVAVEMLLGGLLVAVCLSLLARSPESRTAAAAMARRLPVVMTYVINLGVPPLLFAQVLYGPALYTSSVLIGAWWIAVIPLLIACYWLLYRFSARLDEGGRAWPLGLAAWLLAGVIAKIYSSNMTLMLRPEAWSGMYASSALGALLPHGDPTLMARWLVMLAGGLMMAGLWMLYLAGRSTFSASEQGFLWKTGGRLAAVMAFVVIGAGLRVVSVQPTGVMTALNGNEVYRTAGYLWLALIGLAALIGLFAAFRPTVTGALSTAMPLIALLPVACMAVYRDGIRDLTLLGKGFDVWNRTVVTNWGVVVIFLVLFVAGLGVTGWLVTVVAKARKIKESMA